MQIGTCAWCVRKYFRLNILSDTAWNTSRRRWYFNNSVHSHCTFHVCRFQSISHVRSSCALWNTRATWHCPESFCIQNTFETIDLLFKSNCQSCGTYQPDLLSVDRAFSIVRMNSSLLPWWQKNNHNSWEFASRTLHSIQIYRKEGLSIALKRLN